MFHKWATHSPESRRNRLLSEMVGHNLGTTSAPQLYENNARIAVPGGDLSPHDRAGSAELKSVSAIGNDMSASFTYRRRLQVSDDENSHYGVTGAIRWRGLSCERPKGRAVQSHKRKEPVMKAKLRFLGMDVHAETIAAAIAERMARCEVLAPFRTGWSRYASSSRSLAQCRSCGSAMKPGRLAMSWIGSWLNWASNAR